MLDKLVLNNQILANKAIVQKVRVNLVNKQVRKLRKVKQLGEKHKENRQLQVKVAKCAEVLTALKKIKSTDILRQALLNEKKAQAILTNGLSSPEEIAQALYFSHKTIQGIVTQLKSILNITDSDTSWREQVIEPGKRKKKQLRTEKKQQIRQERKSRKQLDLKRNEWLEENAPEIADNESTPDEPTRKQRTNSLQSSFTEEDADFEPPVAKVAKKQPNNQEKKQKIIPNKSAITPSPPPFRENETDEKDDSEEDPDSAQQHTIDDFFITQTGDHYRSTVVIDRKQPEAPNDGLVRKERRSMQNNGHQRYPNKKRQSYDTSWNKRNNNNREFRRNDRNVSKSFEQSDGASKFPSGTKEPPEKLHPSWAAKQKQKRIDTFQGTKIVFGDDGESSKGSNSKATRKQVKEEGTSDSKEKLHPSWAAKQKLKPSITEFKGQKIVFDDD